MSFQHYLWADDGQWRIPKKPSDLVLPQYANSCQKMISVWHDPEHPERTHIQSACHFAFDAAGEPDWNAMTDLGRLGMLMPDLQEAKAKPVVDLSEVRETRDREAIVAEIRERWFWEPTDEDKDRIRLDLLPAGHPDRRAIPCVKPKRST